MEYISTGSVTTVETIPLSGSPYTISEFYSFLLSKLTTVTFSFDENILANEGLFNLKI